MTTVATLDAAMQVNVGVMWMANPAGLSYHAGPNPTAMHHQQSLSIVPLHVNRHATFADLAAILWAQYGSRLMRGSSPWPAMGAAYHQAGGAPVLFFFRARDGVQVGKNLNDQIASSSSNFAPDQDILLVQSLPGKPMIGAPATVLLSQPVMPASPLPQRCGPNRLFGFLRGPNGDQKRMTEEDPNAYFDAYQTPPGNEQDMDAVRTFCLLIFVQQS
jgi:hypothetical protein